LAAYSKETRHLPGLLLEYGIRFIVIEPLPGSRIDGASFWIDDEKPVVALSIRFDRIDAFWFTVMHELAHIENQDSLSVDTEIIDGSKGLIVMLATDEAEIRANHQAAERLVSSEELESFIKRVGPYYSKERIIQFAHRIKMHPGIIVGQLQHKKELGYGTLRDSLVKIRDIVTATALTDGWNQVIASNLI
jgi:HTH-type transcriptional regulator/antitoxin HigA